MIRKADMGDRETVVCLAGLLWPEAGEQELREDFSGILSGPESAVFLWEGEGGPAAFAQVQLRHDYVEGAETSPVGYLEGVYVREEYRKRGVAAALLRACEAWAAEQGCIEFASDCELTNTASIAFHKSQGFTEANRIVCFTKSIG